MARNERRSKRKPRDAVDPTKLHDDALPSVGHSLTEATEIPQNVIPPIDGPQLNVREIASDDSSSESSDWPDKLWPPSVPSRRKGYQVIIRRSVLNEISSHGQTARDVEVCGVVVGNVFRDEAGPYLSIDSSIRGEHAGSSTAQVTFTAETWTQIQTVMESEHPDERVVGWYHTHPGFGIFLSDMDLFIHGNFFNLPWQVAFVYDPISGEEGLFIWRDGKTERIPFYVDEDVEKEISVPTVPVSPEITAAALGDFSRRMQDMERRHRRLLVLVGVLLLVIIAWPLVLYTILADRDCSARRALGGPEPRLIPVATSEPAPLPTSPSTESTALTPSPTTLPATIPTTMPTTTALTATAPSTSDASATQPVTHPSLIIKESENTPK